MIESSPLAAMRRLHERGPRSRGLVVDREGVALGPAMLLVRRGEVGFECVRPDIVVRVAQAVFGADARLAKLPRLLRSIAGALDAGDLVRAQLLGLQMPISDLDDAQLAKLAAAAELIKVGFDPSQPRDERGRWSSDGGASGASEAASVQVADAGEGTSDAGGIVPVAGNGQGQATQPVPVTSAPIPQPAQRSGNVGEYTPADAAKLPPPPAGSKYLTLADGSVPWTAPYHEIKGGPILVPNNVSIEHNVRAGEKILADYNKALETDAHGADGDRLGTMIRLFDYSGEMDYQRTYGTNGHINRDYIDIGNYNYGAVMAAAGYSWPTAMIAASVANWNGEGEKSWPFGGNPRNLDIARRGYEDYKAGRIATRK
jgi:hypothetical protein